MCKPASFVLTESGMYWSENSDSHEDIKQEYNLQETLAGVVNILPIEITPLNDDYSLPLDQWIFKVDVDSSCIPRWFDAERDEKRAREALKEWAKHKLKTRVEQGNMNTGDRNTGHRNTGDMNTGHRNTGDRNTGHRNTGDRNTGDTNTGHRNTGDMNTGHRNTGDRNTGHMNTGDTNTGDMNTGHRNTGHRNTGHWNTGHKNTGDTNTGDMNTGHRNTGDTNTGHRNTGDWNSCNYSSGVFCTEKPKIKIFDIQTDLTLPEWRKTKQAKLLSNLVLTEWINESEMSEEDKTEHPEAHYLGGYLKKHEWKEACANMWAKFTEEEKECIKQIPNFDAVKFEYITGIKV